MAMLHNTRTFHFKSGRLTAIQAAFTLVEMLAVMGIIVLIIGVAAPVMNSLKGAGDVSKAVYDLAGTLDQARAYAMSNNTYVYVGFQEADATTSESAPKQTDGGVGRVSVVVFASKDGTRGYDVNNPGASWSTTSPNSGYNNGANFLVVGKLQRFSNLHLVDLGTPPTTPGGMERPLLNMNSSLAKQSNLADMDANSVTPFEYPLGNALGGGQYTFNKIIQFDPQGVARIQLAASSDTIVQRMEIGLEQTHGNVASTPATPAVSGSIAAIQLDPMTGSTHIYRP